MKDIQSITSSMPEYWENFYKSGDMGWDLGEPTPIFDNWIASETDPLSICIFGAGNGWDAISFAEKGHNVTAVDFAESAIKNMDAYAQKRGVQINLIHSDLFDLDKLFTHTFDVVLEYTCFCAIDPERRLDYVRITKQILRTNGKLVGIFFPIDKDLNDGGPPFGVDIDSTISLFSKYFTIDTKEIPNLSIKRRNDREVFIIFKNNGD